MYTQDTKKLLKNASWQDMNCLWERKYEYMDLYPVVSMFAAYTTMIALSITIGLVLTFQFGLFWDFGTLDLHVLFCLVYIGVGLYLGVLFLKRYFRRRKSNLVSQIKDADRTDPYKRIELWLKPFLNRHRRSLNNDCHDMGILKSCLSLLLLSGYTEPLEDAFYHLGEILQEQVGDQLTRDFLTPLEKVKLVKQLNDYAELLYRADKSYETYRNEVEELYQILKKEIRELRKENKDTLELLSSLPSSMAV